MTSVIDIPSEWLEESGFDKFVPLDDFYKPRLDGAEKVGVVLMTQIKPPCKSDGIDSLNRSRMLSVLKGIAAKDALPPIELKLSIHDVYKYQVSRGFHRYYASLLAGFTHIPAVVVKNEYVI